MLRVLFVCLGNICRSPTAEGIFSHKVAAAGLAGRIESDSAGTSAWHAGEAPDGRAQEEAERRGIDIGRQRSRAVVSSDFEAFDLILAMDSENLRELKSRCPQDLQGKLHRLLDYAPQGEHRDVPDPYYGGPQGFARVFDMIDDACDGLLAAVRRDHLG
ncbi:MAG: low molecular weight phosphotyrosine protein phosphatase [Candidatus Hydrogenedentes bacterium]|nr:low molecular weight phosphotyrosine protein phosphatase [Candidatus Hydrogenedentota bacterium]